MASSFAVGRICSGLALSWSVLLSMICSAQDPSIDTTWDRHGRIASIWNRATGEYRWFDYFRSGRVHHNGVKVEVGGVEHTVDTTWDRHGRPIWVSAWPSYRGVSFDYDDQGHLARRISRSTVSGTQYNEVTEYFASGVVRSHYFESVESKRFHGIVRRDSVYTSYYPDSRVKSIREYRMGELNGVAIDRFASGNIASIRTYAEGRLLTVQYFDETGRELSHGDFDQGNGWLAIYENGIQTSTCLFKDGFPVRNSCKCD